MTYDEMMNLTLSEIMIMNAAKYEERKDQYRHTRLIMWEIRTKYLKKGKKIKPEDIIKFESEKRPSKIYTIDEKKKFLRKFGHPTIDN